MADGISVELDKAALLRLQKNMEKLGTSAAMKVVRPAVRGGIKTIVADVKARAPVLTGRLKRSIIARRAKVRARNRGSVTDLILFNTTKYPELITFGVGGERYFYPYAVEYGHGTVPPKPYLRPAFETKKRPVTQRVQREIVDGIEGAARRMGRGD